MNEREDTEWKLGISLKKSKAFLVIGGMALWIPVLIVLLLLRVI